MEKLTTAWDFVVKYYPNYDSSDVIAYNEDLCKLTNEDYEEGDDAHKLLIEYYDGEFNSITIKEIKRDYEQSLRVIYEKSILAYLETLNA